MQDRKVNRIVVDLISLTLSGDLHGVCHCGAPGLPAAGDAAGYDAAADDDAASPTAVHVPEPSNDAADGNANAKPMGDVLQSTWPALLLQRTDRGTAVAAASWRQLQLAR